MTEGHIFIQGIISPWQDKFAEDYGEVNIKQVTQQIQNNKDAEKLIVHIHSPGGDVDEGFGIHDILVGSGKEIETRIEGLCASIATVIALAGTTRLITEHSDGLIHTPFGDPGPGDADDMQKYTNELKKVEEKILNFYVDKTGGDKEAISAMMKEETWLNAQQLLDLGFVTEIITTVKAVATLTIKNSNKNIAMNKQEFEKSIDTRFEAIFNRLKEFVKGSKAQALTVTTADSIVLDFGDQVETVEEIETGMTATIEGGGVPDGDLTMTDGAVWVFESGTLTEMKPMEEDDDMEALKQENAELKEQLEAANAQAEQTKIAVKAIQKELVEFKSQVTSNIKTFSKEGFNSDDGGEKENRFANAKPIAGV